MTNDLSALLADGQALGTADFSARVRFLQNVVAAAKSALDVEDATLLAEGAVLDEGQAAVRDLMAALGAIVQWSRGPRSDESLVELELLLRALLRRGLVGVYRAVAANHAAIAADPDLGDAAAESRVVAEVFAAAADEVAQGNELTPTTWERLARLRDRL
jgi:hypothetical protein